jgi:hypothetical protein
VWVKRDIGKIIGRPYIKRRSAAPRVMNSF